MTMQHASAAEHCAPDTNSKVRVSCARTTLSLLSCLAVWVVGCGGEQASGVTAFLSRCGDEPLGVDAITQIDRLPYLRPHAHARAFTSADRSSATGNMDHSQYLSSKDGENTLFDARGPGLVTRFWRAHQPTPGGQYRFYFDDEATPSLVLGIDELWKAQTAPFIPPLTLDLQMSSGGQLTYLPIAFERSLRITGTHPPEKDYYQIDYYQLPEQSVPSGVAEGPAVRAAAMTLQSVGKNPNVSTEDTSFAGTVGSVAAGETRVLLDLAGPAQIVEFVLEIADSETSRAAFAQARLRMTWDGETEPAVDAPAAMFFAHGTGVGPRLRTFMVGNGPLGGRDTQFYSYFPMPFSRAAEISLQAGSIPLDGLEWRVETRPFVDDASLVGQFHARHRVLEPAPIADVISLSGTSGNYVGLVFVPNAHADLEGDVNFYIDDALTPTSIGTGTEDYFNGAWYYDQGSFSTPLHGARLAGDAPDRSGRLSQYRFHPSDPIPFATAFRMTWEMGVGAQAVVYYYENPLPLRTETDQLSVGTTEDEAVHRYENTGRADEMDRRPDVVCAPKFERGRSLRRGATSSFVVSVDPDNAGVALRRRYDALVGAQQAQVSVNGELVGTWQSLPRGAVDQRWAEDEFYLPRALTRGASSLAILIEVDSEAWSEYEYRVYAQRNLGSDCL